MSSIANSVHASEVAAAADQNLERPDRPEGHERNETVVLANHAHLLTCFQCDVVTQQAAMVRLHVQLAEQPVPWTGASGIEEVAQIWQWGCGLLAPIMAPRFSKICTWLMSARPPSSRNCPTQVRTTSSISVQWHGGEREIVTRREANHAANPGLRLGDQQALAIDVETSTARFAVSGRRSRSQRQRSWSMQDFEFPRRGCCRGKGSNSGRRPARTRFEAAPLLPARDASRDGARPAPIRWSGHSVGDEDLP